MTVLHIPDLSKYQAHVDMAKVGPAVILRAHNGRTADRTFSARQAAAREHCEVRGFYGYVVADRDATTQGREFAAIVGKLQPGEFAVCDLESGEGDQAARASAWCRAVDAAIGGHAWIYTGLSFYREHHLDRVKGRNLWIAAYREKEPSDPPHVLWQHTDHERHPGVSGACDCSIFNGTVAQLRAHTTQAPAKAKTPTRPAKVKAAPVWYRRDLRAGSIGQDVQAMQVQLKIPGRLGGYGPRTVQRVKYVQKAHGLPITGRVDRATAVAIGPTPN